MNQALHAVCLSKGLVRQIVERKHWRRLLGVDQVSYLSSLRYRFDSISGMALLGRPVPENALIIDWGNKRQSLADKVARAHSLPVLRVEDGFIRSISAGSEKNQSFSIVLDDMGIYYDSHQASRLECWLNAGVCEPVAKQTELRSIDLNDPALLARARQCIDRITNDHISKYNDLDDFTFDPVDKNTSEEDKGRERILLVDQLVDDLSIQGAAANADTFEQMLDEALDNHPDAEIIIKLHPVAGLGGRRGHFCEQSCAQKINARQGNLQVEASLRFTGKLTFISGSYNAISLLKQIDQVYVVSSQLGFEALMLAKPVNCFALPFYAGWGLTKDKLSISRRTAQRSVEQLFAAAYLLYSHYFDPVSDKPCELEHLLDFMQRQREMFKHNRGVNYCVGFPPWKRAYLRRFLYSPWGDVKFCRSVDDLQKCLQSNIDTDAKPQRAIVWGHVYQYPSLLSSLPAGMHPVQVEDGFIRSVGLGKYYIPPASLVFDQQGIYYDPNQVSDLEHILATQQFNQQQLSSAQRLIEQLSRGQISKYNVGVTELPADLLAQAKDKTTVLVVGQVENDASIKLACKDINNDIALLKQLAAQRPEAVIIYKPHPDVVSGNSVNQALDENSDKQSDGGEMRLYDYRLAEVDMPSCLAIADEVHTMTSLAGFEALIRGIKVFTYGAPFYAGWGLTIDAQAIERRGRQLAVSELVAAVLQLYPRYIDYASGYFISAEQALEKISHDKAAHGKQTSGRNIKVGKSQRGYLKIKNLLASLWYGFRIK